MAKKLAGRPPRTSTALPHFSPARAGSAPDPLYANLFEMKFYSGEKELVHDLLGIVPTGTINILNECAIKWEITGLPHGETLNVQFSIFRGKLESIVKSSGEAGYVEICLHDRTGVITDIMKACINLKECSTFGGYNEEDLCKLDCIYKITNLKIKSDGSN